MEKLLALASEASAKLGFPIVVRSIAGAGPSIGLDIGGTLFLCDRIGDAKRLIALAGAVATALTAAPAAKS